MQRAAVVSAVEGVEQFAVLGNQRNLCGGGACVDAEKGVTFIRSEVSSLYMVPAVAFLNSYSSRGL